MRTSLTTLAAVLMLTATSAFAQQAPNSPVRTEGPFSPFTYERLGATPSIRLPWSAVPAEAKAPVKDSAAAAEGKKSKATAAKANSAPAQATAPATPTTH
jgi:hypothetical protein